MKKCFIFLAYFLMIFSFNSFSSGWYHDGSNWKYQSADGTFLTDTIKKSETDSYYLDDEGIVVSNYLAEIEDNYFYFGESGAMVKDAWVSFEPSSIEEDYFDTKNYYMYFGNNGKAYKSDNGKIYMINGKYYIFNDKGIMMVGWLTDNGEHLDDQYSDDWYSSEAIYYAYEDGSLAEGWLAIKDTNQEEENNFMNASDDYLDITTMYFYFNPKTHKKITGKKNINGKDYIFYDENGRMMTEWEYLELKYGGTLNSISTESTYKNKYYNNQFDGSMAKNMWIYTLPSSVIDDEAYEDYDKKWFFAKNNGSLAIDAKVKINNKNYLFDKKGIMATGLVLLYKNKYYCSIDLENTNYDDLIKEYKFVPSDIKDVIDNENHNWGLPDQDGYINSFFLSKKFNDDKDFILKYYGDDGSEITGKGINITFSDGTYEFYADSKGAYREWKGGKYYQNGFLMKANEDEKYGLVYDLYYLLAGNRNKLIDYSRVSYELYNYFDMYDFINKYTILNPIVVENMIMQRAVPKWIINMPYRESTRLKSESLPGQSLINSILPTNVYSDPSTLVTGNIGYIVDKSGKVLKKGVYKDGDDYWVVDKHKQFVGKFSVPIKWGKTTERILNESFTYENRDFDCPYYKSDILDENGDIKKNKWIKFLDKDAYGKSEVDYISSLDEEEMVNIKFGTKTIVDIRNNE